jgi:hypothetical protein
MIVLVVDDDNRKEQLLLLSAANNFVCGRKIVVADVAVRSIFPS